MSQAPGTRMEDIRSAESGRLALPRRKILLRKDLAPLYRAINNMSGAGGVTVAVSARQIVITGRRGADPVEAEEVDHPFRVAPFTDPDAPTTPKVRVSAGLAQSALTLSAPVIMVDEAVLTVAEGRRWVWLDLAVDELAITGGTLLVTATDTRASTVSLATVLIAVVDTELTSDGPLITVTQGVRSSLSVIHIGGIHYVTGAVVPITAPS
jgi:hypothetical protein